MTAVILQLLEKLVYASMLQGMLALQATLNANGQRQLSIKLWRKRLTKPLDIWRNTLQRHSQAQSFMRFNSCYIYELYCW